MKIIVVAFIILVGAWMAAAATFGRIVRTQKVPPFALGACVSYITQTAADDWAANSSVLSQKIKLTTNVNICRVDLAIRVPPGTLGTIQLRSAANGGGTLYGTSDAGVNTAVGGPQSSTWCSYTFNVPPAVGADFYVTLNATAGTITLTRQSTGNPYNPGAGYDRYNGASQEVGIDSTFKLYYNQQ